MSDEENENEKATAGSKVYTTQMSLQCDEDGKHQQGGKTGAKVSDEALDRPPDGPLQDHLEDHKALSRRSALECE